MNTLVLYHKNCADGIAAAWAVWRSLGDDAEYRAVSYGEDPPDAATRDVVIVDFSYPAATLADLAVSARSVLVLDHHKSAQEDLRGFPGLPDDCSVHRWLNHTETFPTRGSDNTAVVFDMERSGAGLTWDYFHGDPRPRIINFVEDRDLWRFWYVDTKPFHAWLTSQDWRTPMIFYLLDTILFFDENEYHHFHSLTEGRAILRARLQTIINIVRSTKQMHSSTWFSPRFGGTGDVPVCNAPGEFASDVAAALIEGHPNAPFAATYYDDANGRHWSLRSGPGGADVSLIAKHNGGGGHEHASGFREDL